MKGKTRVIVAAFFVLVGSLAGPPSHAQTSTSGTILGSAVDPSGAVVVGAKVDLTNKATNWRTRVTTDGQGHYAFPNVVPGTYSVAIRATGFRTLEENNVVVEVNTSSTINFKLIVGEANATTVEVTGQQIELQTTDATVGDVVNSEALLRLPTRLRSAQELLLLQPGTTPQYNGSDSGGSIAGAENDQTTFTMDGIDISDNSTNSTIDSEHGASPVIAISVESVNEFRVGTTNANSTFNRSSGGQVTLVGKSGTNALHGTLLWYLQNSALNANTWDNNRLGLAKPTVVDNRFGGNLGGPIIKDKTFFFFDYEGRRYPQKLQFQRIVPTATLKQGIIQFLDGAGNVVQYNLATADLCGPSGNAPCDPRGIGISPAMKTLFADDPTGNNSSLGDGLNTIGLQGNVRAPLIDDYTVFRIDHYLSQKWRFNGSFLYGRDLRNDTTVMDIRNPNDPVSLSMLPNWTLAIIGGITGQIRPDLINTFHVGFVRNRNGATRQSIAQSAQELGISGTQTANGWVGLTPSTSIVNTPIDMSNSVRTQANDNVNLQFTDDVSWTRGAHLFQFGTNIQHLPNYHVHTGKLGGAVNSLDAIINAKTYLSLPAADQPAPCVGTVTANCLPSDSLATWNSLYTAELGMMDNDNIFLVRNGQLQADPLGTALVMNAHSNAFYFYGQDTWRVRSSLTFTYGLSYGFQTPYTLSDQKEALLINAGTGQVLTNNGYLTAKKNAALQGQIYNPLLGFLPVAKSGRGAVYNTDWGNVAPRISAAWSPSYRGGIMGKVFGERKSVVRGGFGMFYSKLTSEDTVVGPGLTAGFTSTASTGLTNCMVSAAPGANCNATTADPALSTFRVGVDGTIPIPTYAATAGSPYIPGPNYGELISFGVSPDLVSPRIYSADLTLQRELGRGVFMEVAYNGRWGRRLLINQALNSNPYMFVDQASKQSFATAYDAVATALRNGTTPSAQPFFENQLPGIGGPGISSTSYLVSNYSADFTTGLVSSLFVGLDNARLALGLQPYDEQQVNLISTTGNGGWSNYNAALLTLRKTGTHFTFNVNYTFSKSIDTYQGAQNDSANIPNPYFPGVDYGPSIFDRTHTFNAFFVYSLPKHFSRFNGPVNRILGGWYISGIFTAVSGLPLQVIESDQAWGGGLLDFTNYTAAVPTVPLSAINVGVHSGVTGSNGIGTNSDPAQGGTGLNLFANPQSVYNDFRPILLSTDGRSGRGDPLRGLGYWNLDDAIGKKIPITERVNLNLSFDFYNIFNHVSFQTPDQVYSGFGLYGASNEANFGAISNTFVPSNRQASSRWIMLGLRVEF